RRLGRGRCPAGGRYPGAQAGGATRSVTGWCTGPRPGGCAASGRALAADASGDDPDVFRLGSLLSLGDVELDLLLFLQAAVAATRDRAEVHEYIRAALRRDETVALIAVEPLHRALRNLDLLRCGRAPAMAAGVHADSRDCSGQPVTSGAGG